MEEFERSYFALGERELEIHEALRALERLLERRGLGEAARLSLNGAVETLRRELR